MRSRARIFPAFARLSIARTGSLSEAGARSAIDVDVLAVASRCRCGRSSARGQPVRRGRVRAPGRPVSSSGPVGRSPSRSPSRPTPQLETDGHPPVRAVPPKVNDPSRSPRVRSPSRTDQSPAIGYARHAGRARRHPDVRDATREASGMSRLHTHVRRPPKSLAPRPKCSRDADGLNAPERRGLRKRAASDENRAQRCDRRRAA